MRRTSPLALGLPAVLLALVGMAGSPAPAAAYSESSTGYPGYVGVPYVDGQWHRGSGYIYVGGRVVGDSESYGNYHQYVCQHTRLWRINRQSWVLDNVDTRCKWLYASEIAVGFPRIRFGSLVNGLGYSVDVRVTWQLSNGSQIGKTVIDYRHVGDYRCSVNCLKGTTNWGGGAFIMFML